MVGNFPQNGFKDTILICVDCHEEFVFTASAQQYFAERGFTEPPKRCKACYTVLKRNGRIPEGETLNQNGGRIEAIEPNDDRIPSTRKTN